jgi:quercetin 2,3-dioxygenase
VKIREIRISINPTSTFVLKHNRLIVVSSQNFIIMANSVLHKANSRGHARHGWLETHHTFSFANYYDPRRMNFGVLRVMNDDIIAPSMGFGMHPHQNMEIITIPLEGELEHKDSMGNQAVIHTGEIQVMSAGKGIYHSEYNHSRTHLVQLLQIWMFPNQQNVEPRYDELKLNPKDRLNLFQQILSPNPDDAGVWVHQNAWFHLGSFDKGVDTEYVMKDKSNGLYIFVIEGSVQVGEQLLERRDGYGIQNIDKIHFQLVEKAEILLMEVPMDIHTRKG